MRRMITLLRGLLTILIFISLVGCADGITRRGIEAAMNFLRLADLEIGMTKDEVIDLMGEPSKTEVYEIQGRNVESWLYLTEYERPYSAPDPIYTPLVFEEDVLKGWGMPYYNQAIKQGTKIEQ